VQQQAKQGKGISLHPIPFHGTDDSEIEAQKNKKVGGKILRHFS